MIQAVQNLHNHTPFSDGSFEIDELCEAHLKARGVRVEGVGICDHLFRTPSSQEVGSEREFQRLFSAETRTYVDQIQAAKQRWAGKLRIFCGAEIHWGLNRAHLNAIREMLGGLDFVLFENLDWAGLTQLANQVRRWPVAVGLAHTNVPRQFPNTSIDQVVRTLANARLFYEVNVKEWPFTDQSAWFRLLPRHRVALSLGTDTHDDLDCIERLADLVAFLEQRSLADRYVQLEPRPRELASA